MTAPKRSKKVTEVSEDAVPITSTTEPAPVSTSTTAPASTSTTVTEPGPIDTIVIPDDPMTPTVTSPESAVPENGRDVLRRVLDVPKGKRDVPTLISYRNQWTGVKRHLIIDVAEPILRTAWDEWRTCTGQTDPEIFIGDVCAVLDTDYPRMYRTVVPLDL